jgi:hypothetical protein
MRVNSRPEVDAKHRQGSLPAGRGQVVGVVLYRVVQQGGAYGVGVPYV